MDGIRTFETTDGRTIELRVRPESERPPRTTPSPNAILVLDKLVFWAKRDGRTYCETKHENLADWTCRSERTVGRAIAELVRLGFVAVRKLGQGLQSEYHLSATGLAFIADLEEKRRQKRDKKVRPKSPAFAVRAPAPLSGQDLPTLSGQDLPTLSGQDLPTLSGQDLPTLSGQDLPTGGATLLSPCFPNSNPRGRDLAAVRAALLKIKNQEVAMSEDVAKDLAELAEKRTWEEAEMAAEWLADRLTKGDPPANPVGYARDVFRNPRKYGFTVQGGKLCPPADAAKERAKADAAKEAARKAYHAAEAEKRKREDEAARREKKFWAENIDLAAWWLELADEHRRIVQAKVDQWPAQREDQSWKFYIAVKFFVEGKLPGASPPPHIPDEFLPKTVQPPTRPSSGDVAQGES